MNILLTNDDGILAPGLAAMARVLRRLGNVLIVAPAVEQSGVGQSLTFQTPLVVKEFYRDDLLWGYAVEGTPIDCVKAGLGVLASEPPDLIVSGLNNGLNVGINIMYSGTVAAALEGSMQGVTSFAVSFEHLKNLDPDLIEKGAEAAFNMIQQLLLQEKGTGALFNINIPQAAIAQAENERVVSVVPMDIKPYWNTYERREDPMNRAYYWLKGRPLFDEKDRFTDVGEVSRGHITVTPLDFDMTNKGKMTEVQNWSLVPPSIPSAAESDDITCLRMLRNL